MSSRQDRTHTVSIHRAPAHLSKAQFDQKMDAYMDAFSAVPVVKKNALKIEMFVPNNIIDMHAQEMGFPVPHPTVIVLCEWESHEQMLETAGDPTVMRVVAGAIADFGLDVGSCVFHANVVTKIDLPSHQDSVWGCTIHPVPVHLSKAQLEQRIEALADTFIAVPVVKKNLLRFKMLVQSSTLDTDVQVSHLQGLGLPEPQPTVVLLAEWKSQEQLVEAVSDLMVKNLVASVIADFGFDGSHCGGAVDVVTKLNKA
ncbi:hypothetical protein C8R44DRAFT_326094 [Mycena epipterygia]|nr:hypothetical protein C8R44DRAFT_326094 [Mycena epipterygia]